MTNPGGTNHFPHSGTPADKDRAAEYEAGPYKGYGKKIHEAFATIVPPDEDAGPVADAVAKVVDASFGKRPFRVHVDPTQDGGGCCICSNGSRADGNAASRGP
jgi:hypothetical protein